MPLKEFPARQIRARWKPRKKASHKGDFGRVFILAGSKGFTGAAHLAAAAALRSGAGLVTLGVPETVYGVLARREAEVMVKSFPATKTGSFSLKALKPALDFLKTQDVLALGPGISRSIETRKWALGILKKGGRPVILDADGINALEGLHSLKFLGKNTVLTPHAAEFVRAFRFNVSGNAKDRLAAAKKAAALFGGVVVLKGHETVVASGTGEFYVNHSGNPGMAKGGTGDVLTGMIAALAGQGLSLFDAACFSVYLHGVAGDLAVREIGEASLTAGDLLDFLPRAIKKIRGI